MSASDKKRLRKEQAAAALTEKQLKEQKEAKTLKRHTLTFIVAMILVVAIAFGVVAAQGIDRTGIIQRNTNAVTFGDYTLTSADLNYYFVDAVNNFYSQVYEQYGDQAELYSAMIYGLDFSTPLNTQVYSYTQTWAEYFAESAVESAKNIYALYAAAIADGVTLSEDEQKNFEESISLTESYATQYYGYNSLKAYLKDVFGYGATEESYRNYMMVNTVASKYYNAYGETLEYDKEDFKKYSDEHYDELSSFTYATYYVDNTDFLGEGQKDSNGIINYTDAQKEAALKTGQEIVNKLTAAGIKTSAQLDEELKKIEQYKDDDSAVSVKYTDKMYSDVSSKLVSWVADSSRKVGDFTAIADTSTTKDDNGNEIINTAGYYIVVFEGRNDNEMQLVNVRHILKKFQGGTPDNSGITYSDADKAATLKSINMIKLVWQENGASEEAFIEMVKDNTDDSGSADNGGLYENVYPKQMIEGFDDWCFDPSREAGDYDIVETSYGYHLIYFVGYDEMTYRDMLVEEILYNEAMDAWYTDITKNLTATNINTAHLDLDLIVNPS